MYVCCQSVVFNNKNLSLTRVEIETIHIEVIRQGAAR